ncbi:hypothetical protein [Chryseobacterium populi]|uniref:Uncharacterized protein n=1 Tax=Chryseobacterium populi TaxID=1144316 RepID=J2T6F2_9FLAO|nr:hypothetical protein [Chryseobacterium populi]EJL73607.1 hypothetical protein PMI13_01564 [Chryseobacterium populi]
MKKFCFLISITVYSLSCNKKDSPQIVQNIDSISLHKYKNIELGAVTNNTKIKKIKSKQEMRNDGDFNQMTIFEVDKAINLEELKNYCSIVKPSYSTGYFQILVFFKKPDSAKFPDNPVTGMFMEDEDLKNIKATYIINNINGYSKLNYYEKNSFESVAQSIDIN